MSDKPPYLIARREREGHKGIYGSMLVLGGSRGMAGAPAMAAMACLRAGAGRVTVATPSSVCELIASFSPAYMTHALSEDERGRIACSFTEVADLVKQYDYCGIGPGLGRSSQLDQLINEIYQRVDLPLVLDADALNALATTRLPSRVATAPRIMTPHPGEFRRLLDSKSPAIGTEAWRQVAQEYAHANQIVLVLKSHETIVTTGSQTYVNATGNPGMATGGSGDVLTGLILGLLGQGLEVFEACSLATWIHGRAGDLAATVLGQVSLIATDLIDHLPEALRECGG